MKTWHKIGLGVAALLAIASWGIALYYWNQLPATIPTHFGISGAPDAWNPKTIWYSFLIPALQTIMLGAFVFLYYKPQYSDMPTTLWLNVLTDRQKEHAFGLIRTMLVGISLWIGVLFTYLTYMMNLSALKQAIGPDPWIMLGLIGGMLIWLVYWTIIVYRATKSELKKGGKNV